MTMPPENDGGKRKTTAEVLRTSLRRLALATAILYLVIIGFGAKVYHDGHQTNSALCTFRDDLAQRVLQTTQFLKDHPEGFPGVSSKQILDSVSNQQKTILSLKSLNCPS